MSRLADIVALGIFSVTFGFSAGAGAQTCTPPRPGLVGWWDADMVSGTTVQDLGDGNSGLMRGGVTVVPDPHRQGPRKFARAFHFDGSGLIDMGNPKAFQFGAKPFSLEAWFVSDGGEAEHPHIISKSNYPVAHPGAGYWIRLTPDKQSVEFFVGETLGAKNFPRARITAPASPGVWHHAVGTRDARGGLRFYVDGHLAGSDSIAPTFSVDAETPFTLGAWNEHSGIRNFAFFGHMADISAYDRDLTASEVNALFSAPKCKNGAR